MSKLFRLLRYDLPLHFVLLLTNWLPDNVIFLRLRGSLASMFLGQCGNDLSLGRNITFYNPSQIHIGNNVYIAYGCWIMAAAAIVIDDDVMLAPYVVISSGNHTQESGSFRRGIPILEKITIGRGCWIGSHVSITSGAEIGYGCLIAANAAVTKGIIPCRSLMAGVPAKIKKTLVENYYEQ